MNRYFYVKLTPPRATFAQDMSEDEQSTMREHVMYWTALMHQGKALAFGPVLDPNGPYGVGILQVETDEAVDELIDADPARGINQYEFYPMMALVQPPQTDQNAA